MRKASSLFILVLIAVCSLENGVAQGTTDSTYHTKAALKRGCYVSVQEFLTNSPSIVDSFVVQLVMRDQMNWEGTLSATPRYAKNKRKIKKIWGFSDGENAYVFHQIEFFKILSDDTGHHFFGYELIHSIHSDAASLYGGAIGGGIALTVVTNNCKKQKVEYEIHEETGWALHPNLEKNKPISVEQVVLFRLKKGEVETPMEFLLNDTLRVEFVQNSFKLLELKEGTTSIKICHGSEFEMCEVFTLIKAEINYFKVTISDNTKEQEIVRLDEVDGNYYSFKAMKAQKKREKKILN